MNPYLREDIENYMTEYWHDIHKKRMRDIFHYINEELFNVDHIFDMGDFGVEPPYTFNNAYNNAYFSEVEETTKEISENKMYEVGLGDYWGASFYVILHRKINDKWYWYYEIVIIDIDIDIDDDFYTITSDDLLIHDPNPQKFYEMKTKLNHIKEIYERYQYFRKIK